MLTARLQLTTRPFAMQADSIDRSLRRLSSGLRINQASDDAAGLSISSKLRSQVLGYAQAGRNIQDAASMMQTADGGLEGIQGALQRMRVLALIAGNDTLTTEDRERVQAEIDQIRRGIQQIAEGTTFNTHQVLRGEMTGLSNPFDNLDVFTRGQTRSRAVNSPSLNQQQSVTYPVLSYLHGNREAFSTRDFNPGWSADDSEIQIQSTRGAGSYVIPSAGGHAAPSGAGAYTRDQTREIGGHTYTLSNFRTGAGGNPIFDGIYVTRDLGVKTKLVNFTDSSGVQMAFSNDGTRIAYTGANETDVANVDVYVANFNPAAMSVAGAYRLNQDGDMLDVPQTYALGAPAEWYQRTDGQHSLKIFVERNTPAGTQDEVPYDATGVSGFTLAPDRRTVTLHGAYQVDSNDVIRAFYQNDYNQVTDDDGNISLVPPTVPEVYGLGTAAASARIEMGGVAVAYDPTHTNGFDYDPSTKRFTLYGDARPAGNQNVRLYFQGDRLGSSTYDDSDENAVVGFTLPERPELYNLTNASPSKSIRVLVGGTEVAHDDGSGHGYTYEPATNRILLHGNARPSATQTVNIRYVVDGGMVTNQDGKLEIKLSSAADTYYQPTDGPSRSLRVHVGGVEVPLDDDNGYSYDASTRIVTFNGTAIPDAGQSISVRWIPQNDADDLYTWALGDSPELYDPDNGSIVVTSTQNGALTRTLASDGSGNGYFMDGNDIRFVGSARPNASGGWVTYTAHYVRPGDNAFTLSPTAAAPPTIGADCLPHYIPPTVSAAVLDEGSLVVRVNGSLVAKDDADGWSLTKTEGPIIDGVQTYAQYEIVLNGDARLMGRAGGNAVTVEYDFSYAAPSAKEYAFMVGANTTAQMITRIPPVGIDELDLNAFCVLDAEQAKEAVLKADAAIARVSEIRAGIGATINGLNHQLTNVQQMGILNDQARSRIVDADMAEEVMAMTKAQVMAQSATAMLQHGRMNSQRVQDLIMSGAR